MIVGAPIPKAVLPWLALGLGVAGSLIAASEMGQAMTLPLVASYVLEGLFAGGFAVAGAETVAKLPASSKTPPILALVAFLGGSVAGCTPQDAKRFADAASAYVRMSDTMIREAYEIKIDACETEQCVDEVREEYRKASEASDAFREVWCGIDPEAEGC